MLLCCPADPAWIGTVRGRVYELAIGRTWDEQTGRVTDVQKIGEAIWQSMATCKLDDLVAAVEAINVTLSGFNGSTVTEKVAFELGRINYNLDRIRDNLDSFAPDGNEETEYGLATILAAMGPNVTKSTEFIKAIKDALNTNIIGFPDESGEFAEGTSPALADVTGHITSLAADYLGGDTLRLQFTMTGDSEILVWLGAKSRAYTLKRVNEPTTQLLVSPSEFSAGTTGSVRVIDQKFNIFEDTY